MTKLDDSNYNMKKVYPHVVWRNYDYTRTQKKKIVISQEKKNKNKNKNELNIHQIEKNDIIWHA